MEDIKAIIRSSVVVFFSKPNCPYCIKLEADLASMQVAYLKVVLENRLRDALIELTSQKTVPQLFIGGVFVGGYDNFSTMCATGMLDALLLKHDIVSLLIFDVLAENST
jgi:glutaredoxin 3